MKSKVYFTPIKDGSCVGEQAEAFKKIYNGADVSNIISKNDFVAIKLHIGEKGNTTHVNPEIIKALVEEIKVKGGQPFLTETSTLYKGERENAVKHLLLAHNNGFGIDGVGAPFIMSDGLMGNDEAEVSINGKPPKTVKIARGILSADVLFAVSHVTGHMVTGLGAAIKNLGMGLASRKGKLRQHSALKPEIKVDKCMFCKKCIQWCPESAIAEASGKVFILTEKCIGCGECLVVCRFDAVKFDWGVESGHVQKSMAEHAYGVIKNKIDKCFFFNVLIDMTKDCDCFNVEQKKIIPDVGILASRDPVAIDMATLDLTAKTNGKTLAELSYENKNAMVQIEYAAEIGMGDMDYELVVLK